MVEDFKVVVDAGHGGSGVTPGKRTPDGEYEWNFNDVVVKAIENELKKYDGVAVKRVDDRTGKKDIDLDDRVKAANAFKADIYVSVHHNANTGKWGTWTGTETYIMTGTQPGSTKLAKLVHPEVVEGMGLKDRGIKTAQFYVLKFTQMPAILIECGYMDSTIDIKKMRNKKVLENVGVKIARAIAEYGKLKKKVVADKPKEEAKPTTKPIKVDTVVTKDVVHGVKSGETLWNISRKYGVGISAIKTLNGLKSDVIQPGQKLVIKRGAKKIVRVSTNALWVYNAPNWNAKDHTVKRGEVFTVVATVTVDGAKMYKLASGLYITASTKYVSTRKV